LLPNRPGSYPRAVFRALSRPAVAAFLGVATVLLTAAVAEAQDSEKAAGGGKLRALVLEHFDRRTHAKGAKILLEKAGFTVADIDVGKAPSPQDTDLIVFGSFAVDHADYGKFVKKHKGALAAFVKDGGVVIQFTQAATKEGKTPFLPAGLQAIRSRKDFQPLFVLSKDHPLLAGLPRVKDDAGRLDLPTRFGRDPNWRAFRWQEGFGVIAASNEDGRHVALMEAEHGKGRFVVTSLAFDKAFDEHEGAIVSPAAIELSETFFANIATYVASVRGGKAPKVTETPSPKLPKKPKADGEPVAVAWGLARSDLAVYVRTRSTLKYGLEVPGKTAFTTVATHDFSDERQYRPVSPRRGDLPGVFALRLPPEGKPAAKVDFMIPLLDTLDVRVKGTVASASAGEGRAVVTGEYTFASKGKPGRNDKTRIRKGTAKAWSEFDLERGVVVHAFVEYSFELEKFDAKRKEKPATTKRTFRFELGELQRARYSGYRDDVNAAIDRGAAYLRAIQKEDGTVDPHGNWKIGTNALVALTLSACDVPVSDPAVEKLLAWLVTKNPKRVYEQSVSLMAFAKAYSEKGASSDKLLELPPERLAWCQKVATGLEKNSGSPGSWGYPPTSPRLVLQFDSSNTQYAVLGLRAASRMGFETQERTWLGVIRHFELVREKKAGKGAVALVREGEAIADESKTAGGAVAVAAAGGFRYATLQQYERIWGSMTCAGIASLDIARHQLRKLGSSKLSKRVDREVDKLVLGGWAWLDRHWATDRHPQHPGGNWYYYYLYSLERAAVLDGVKRVGGHDWYFEGAAQLLARQNDDGSWGTNEKDVTQTCFALLFLKRATAPLTR